MTKPRTINTEAIVLRAAELGEADRLLTLLTPAHGKLHATARGVRKTTSKLGGHLDLLTRSALTLSYGNQGTGLATVTGAEALDSFMSLKADLRALSKALYLGELADTFHPLEAPNPPAYTSFLEALQALESPADHDLVLRSFELRLLDLCGFLPQLARCVQCEEPVLPGGHFLSPAAGGVLCPACKPSYGDALPISVDALKVVRYLAANSLSSSLLVNVRLPLHRELAALMSSLLRYTLERELRSTAFLRAIAQQWPKAEDVPSRTA
ncbi:MAG: DNA repair protein RecO [Chloroflexi bacterium]|nr:DNA repair protein RecO [Chloroflexota bacterium]